MVLEITAENFKEVVEKSVMPVLVDFWATWCGPCRMVAPIIEEIAKDYEGRAIIAKVNVDNDPALAERFSIMTIPTILIFKDGKVVDQVVGIRTKEDFSKMLDAWM